MYAATIDTGPTVATLRAFGPPEVDELDAVAGNAAAVHRVSGFWEGVRAISVELATDANVAARVVRVRYFAGEAVPFAEVLAPFAVAAAQTARVTFAVGVQPAGALNGPSIVAELPELLLVPGYTIAVDVLAGVAGDAVRAGRVYRQRFRLVELEPE